MRELATNDSLTGLLNRRAFFHNSNNFIYFAEREQMPLSIMVVDLDKFKIINDGHGHPAGDKVLKHFGKSVKSISRDGDLAGRIGGEEFSLLLPNTSEDGALAFAERLHSFVRKSTILHGQSSIKYTISIGLVSLVPNEDDNIESIIKNADKSLYMAKEKGRNRTEIFNANKVR
ncbi:MAG: GGDEF domain-containing protein [Candidatus Thiodiazotropha sp.]